MTVVLSLLAAFSYGVGDFFGGIASKKLHPVAVSIYAHATSLTVALLATLIVNSTWSISGSTSGAIAGACEAVGFLGFYYVLSLGSVAIIAPLVALIYAVVPVAWAVLGGEQLTTFAWIGMLAGITAIYALTKTGGKRPTSLKNAKLALAISSVSGISWGFATIALNFAPTESGATPAATGALVSLLAVLALKAVLGSTVKLEASVATKLDSMLSGGLFGLANTLILLALASGQLALVGFLTALYPLATVFLARLFLKDHISKTQWFGIFLAVTAAILMSQ